MVASNNQELSTVTAVNIASNKRASGVTDLAEDSSYTMATRLSPAATDSITRTTIALLSSLAASFETVFEALARIITQPIKTK